MATNGYKDITFPILHDNGEILSNEGVSNQLLIYTTNDGSSSDVYLGFRESEGSDCTDNFSKGTSSFSANISGCTAIVEGSDSTARKIKFSLSKNTESSNRTVTFSIGSSPIFSVSQAGETPVVDPVNIKKFSINVTQLSSWSVDNIEFNEIVTNTTSIFHIIDIYDSSENVIVPIGINMNENMAGQTDSFEFTLLYDNLPCTRVENLKNFDTGMTKYMYDRSSDDKDPDDKYLCGTFGVTPSGEFSISIDYHGSTGNISFSSTDQGVITPSLTAFFGSGADEQSLNIIFTLNLI